MPENNDALFCLKEHALNKRDEPEGPISTTNMTPSSLIPAPIDEMSGPKIWYQEEVQDRTERMTTTTTTTITSAPSANTTASDRRKR